MLYKRGIVKQISMEEEYKKNPWISPEDIRKLREWVKSQPHLPHEYITDQELIRAYFFSEGSAEVSKQLLDESLTLRTHYTILFKDRTVDEVILNTLKVVSAIPTDVRTPDGYQVIYVQILDPEPKNYVFADNARFTYMLSDLFQYEVGTGPGIVIVIDLSGFSFGHLARFELTAMHQAMHFLQKGLFLKIRGFHFINAPPIVDKLMVIMRPFFTSSLLEVLHIHCIGSRTLKEFVPVEELSKYDNHEVLKAEVTEKLKVNQDFFVQENKKRVAEALRPDKARQLNDIFEGVEGSFKKLDID